jgi:hypothetical protein
MDNPADRVWANPKFQALRHQVWQRWRRLAADKEFLWETARLKFNLTRLFQGRPADIRKFFSPIFRPDIFDLPATRRLISASVRNAELRETLQHYLTYVIRFGVLMRLSPRMPYFRTQLAAEVGSTFHVAVRSRRLAPAMPQRWDGQTPMSDFYTSDQIDLDPEMKAIVDKGLARYVEIDHEHPRSILNELLEFAYSSDQITFIRINADQKYLLCLLGENVSVDATWRHASKIVSEFQKKHYGRVRSGRRPKFREIRKRLSLLLRGKGNLTSKAITLLEWRGQLAPTDSQVRSRLSSLSQAKRKLGG